MVETVKSKYGQWILTDEQVALIKAKDMATMAQFYNDNYDKIKFRAFRYLNQHAPSWCEPSRRREPSRYSLTDMMQQAYVDLPYIDYRSAKTIGLSFYRIFDRVDIGGLTSDTDPRTLGLCILDEPQESRHRSGDIEGESGKMLADYLAESAGILPMSAEDTYLKSLEKVSAVRYLSQYVIRDILRDALTTKNEYAVMAYEVFTNLTDYEISEALGLSKWNTVEVIRERVNRMLAGQYHKILDKLRAINSPYYERFCSLLPRQEEKKRDILKGFSVRAAAVSP